jgi:hypothetical protein
VVHSGVFVADVLDEEEDVVFVLAGVHAAAEVVAARRFLVNTPRGNCRVRISLAQWCRRCSAEDDGLLKIRERLTGALSVPKVETDFPEKVPASLKMLLRCGASHG